jgi:hypothetical protein
MLGDVANWSVIIRNQSRAKRALEAVASKRDFTLAGSHATLSVRSAGSRQGTHGEATRMARGQTWRAARNWRTSMDEDKLNMEIRKFLKEVGVTSQREIERVLREGQAKGSTLHLKMSLTSTDVPSLEHVVEHEIQLS